MTGPGGRSNEEDLRALIASAAEARPEDPSEVAGSVIPAVTWRVGGRWFGSRADHVDEVVARRHVTRVPMLPPAVSGVALIHGRLVPVIELSRLIDGLPAGRAAPTSPRLVVLHAGDDYLAVTADETRGVLELALEAAAAERSRVPFISGLGHWSGEPVFVVEPGTLLAVANDG